MQRILWNGANGISAQLLRLNTVGNNLANSNTPAFKKQEVVFAELLREKMLDSGKPVTVSNEPDQGIGVKVSRTGRDFTPGPLRKSDNPLSLAIDGKGFMRVVDNNGAVYYTRDGNFHRNAGGQLINASGFYLPEIEIPAEADNISIDSYGSVTVKDMAGNSETVGQIRLYSFSAPQGLEAAGDNLFRSTEASGETVEHTPGTGGAGFLRQGFKEMSNTEVTDEMIKLISTQRAVQLNARTITTADRLWEMAINLRR